MNANSINQALNAKAKTKFQYKGIFNLNQELPPPNKNTGTSYVIYVENESFKHWVCSYSPNSTLCYFFDPVGNRGIEYHKIIINQLNRHYQEIVRLVKPIQPPRSITCGYFILHFLHHCTETLSNPESYYQTLSESRQINEITVFTFVNSYYPKVKTG